MTDKQDGSQGAFIRKDTEVCYQISSAKEYKLKEGYYLDLTDVIQSTGKFERIAAQGGWQSSYNKTECGIFSTSSTSSPRSWTKWS